MRQAVRNGLARSFELYDDLAASIPEEALGHRIPGSRSNTIGSQLWCVIGARESHARAVRAGTWQGFSCSLAQTDRRDPVIASLESSAGAAMAAMDEAPHAVATDRLIVDLLEHEAAHEGQLIRYLYALDLPIPPSWRERFSLE